MAPSSLDPDFLGGRLGREPSEPFGEFIAVAHSPTEASQESAPSNINPCPT